MGVYPFWPNLYQKIPILAILGAVSPHFNSDNGEIWDTITIIAAAATTTTTTIATTNISITTIIYTLHNKDLYIVLQLQTFVFEILFKYTTKVASDFFIIVMFLTFDTRNKHVVNSKVAISEKHRLTLQT